MKRRYKHLFYSSFSKNSFLNKKEEA